MVADTQEVSEEIKTDANEESNENAETETGIDKIKAPVRVVVELILRFGNIDTGIVDRDVMLLGARAHRKIQKSKHGDYKSEVHLTHEIDLADEIFDFILILEGRADGIFTDESGIACIDEIKSTLTPLELIDGTNPVHWGQAMCYAFIHASKNSLEKINVQLTYCQISEEDETQMQDMKFYIKSFTFRELSDFVNDLMKRYAVWVKLERDWKITRNESIEDLKFPFERYRKGQRELAASAYRTIIAEKKLFANAPTGIGKTISTVFPAVKAMPHSNLNKLFYLTAKTITRAVAEDAVYRLQKNGLRFKTVTITAKDKICFYTQRNCTPEYCVYAKGHFDRINDAVLDTFRNNDAFTREIIEKYAKKHTVCPYEFSLELSSFTDSVICDYNYVFDPRVYLRRFFQYNTDRNYVFLVDEAHNLIDRAREMYSAEIRKSAFVNLKKALGKTGHRAFKKAINEANKYLVEQRKKCLDEENKKGYIVLKEYDAIFHSLLENFRIECEVYLKEQKEKREILQKPRQKIENIKNLENTENSDEEDEKIPGYEEALNLYFSILVYQLIAQFYDERYVTYISAEDNKSDLIYKLFCLDPSYLIGESLKKAKSTVFFSATLSPMSYYKEVLSGTEEDNELNLLSPFDINNFCLAIAYNIKTKYKVREESYVDITEYINTVVNHKKGNYLVFFPSYEYMRIVHEIFHTRFPDTAAIIQTGNMSEEERELFLNNFTEDAAQTLVGFCVLGGIFSEGIDLVGDRLTGAIIIGVGLPKLSAEGDIIKEYFNHKNGLGYEYSYMFPGMNKVLQAVGRVIRTESDKGVVLLLDERFNYSYYKKLFPAHWSGYKTIKNPKQIQNILDKFWK